MSICERCIDEIVDLQQDRERLKEILRNVRTACREQEGITTREFARMCGISPAELSKWTAELPSGQPDMV